MSSKLSHVVQEEGDEAIHLAQSCGKAGFLGTCSPKDLWVRFTLSEGWQGTPFLQLEASIQ